MCSLCAGMLVELDGPFDNFLLLCIILSFFSSHLSVDSRCPPTLDTLKASVMCVTIYFRIGTLQLQSYGGLAYDHELDCGGILHVRTITTL